MTETLQGQIEHLTYHSEETGYTVAKVRVRGRSSLVTVVGNLIAPLPGEVLIMEGDWTTHAQYGPQFSISSYKSKVPATVSGIRKYLGSGLIKGIGPGMAERIVKRFGDQTLDIIEHRIDRLQEVDGIGPKRVDMIRAAWDDQKEIRRVMIFLRDHGVGAGFAARIFKVYGDRAVELIKADPYRLAQDIPGIGFLTADRIAGNLGIDPTSEVRARAGLMYVLQKAADEGHVYFPYLELLDKAREVLQIDRDKLALAVSRLAVDKRIAIQDLNEDLTNYRENYKAVFLSGYYLAEVNVSQRLKQLLAAPKSIRSIDTARATDWACRQLGLELAERQLEALQRAAADKVLVITGGPGTGKTTIIRAVLAIYHRLGARVLLAAPTGRAAKRMSEATGAQALTIHRLLDFSWQEGGFRKNDRQPLDCDLLIVDESSMIDILLMHHLLKATPPQATLILVGDVDQLPSVGPGNVLQDIISSRAIPVVRLQEIFRQARESAIIVNAHRINQGQMPLPSSSNGRLTDFYFIERSQPEEALETVIEVVSQRIPQRFGLDPVDEVQVLSPMNRGLVGAENLNQELQKVLNPAARGLTRGGVSFSVHDKVMQTRNNYDKDVFNGDLGRITGLDMERRELIITFDGRPISYDFSDLDEVVLAYAVTVHKSQGSEYPAVVVPVLTQHYALLQRNLLYTAVTRGRRLVVLVGTKKALGLAISREGSMRRYTRLSSRLI